MSQIEVGKIPDGEAEFKFLDGKPNKKLIEEEYVRKILTEDVGTKRGRLVLNFLDVSREKVRILMENHLLSKEDKEVVLNVYWSLLPDFFKSREITFPESLKSKLISDPEWLLEFVEFIGSWYLDMEKIAEWKKKMSPEEEKFIWQLFHRKFEARSNRGFEDFPKDCQAIIVEIIERYNSENQGEPISILDAGCGPEANAIRDLKNKYKDKVLASGINMEIYDSQTEDVDLKEGDLRNMPFADNSFDLVYEIAVAGHLRSKEDIESFVTEVLRVLKPKGKFLLTDAYPDLKFLDALGIKYKILKEKPYLLEKLSIK